MDLDLLKLSELKAIARENPNCKGYSTYKKKTELLAFIKKCTKNSPERKVGELRALAKKQGCSKLKKDELIEQAQLPVQPPSRIKKSLINYENHIVQIFNEMNSTFEPKTINPIALQQINE